MPRTRCTIKDCIKDCGNASRRTADTYALCKPRHYGVPVSAIPVLPVRLLVDRIPQQARMLRGTCAAPICPEIPRGKIPLRTMRTVCVLSLLDIGRHLAPFDAVSGARRAIRAIALNRT